MRSTLERIAREIEATPHLLRLGRLFSETVLLRVDGQEWFLHFRDGRIEWVQDGPSRRTPWRVAIETDAEALAAFWAPLPAPGFHDLFGLVKIGRARIEGDILVLVKNLRFVKEVLAMPRGWAEARP